MESLIKNIRFMRFAAGCMVTAADAWFMLIVLLWAFDKPIRWYVWVILVLEIMSMLRSGGKVNRKED